MSTLWRPFSIPGAAAELNLVKGEGARLCDSTGREYLDAAGGLWNVSLGLNHPRLLDAMQRQMRSMPYSTLFDASHSAAEQLSKRLVDLTDRAMSCVYLSTTGSTAVEAALRVARIHHQVKGDIGKRRILSFDQAYHGTSGLGICASGILAADYLLHEQASADFQLLPSPLDEELSLGTIERLLATDADQIACLIMEPVMGSAGVIVPSTGYCRQISELCRRYNVLLIADEVATGIGRCGAWFASSLLGLRPDIIALSKGLNSGYYPLGATLFSERVVAPIAQARVAFQFGSTQDGNPVGCVSALATIDAIVDDALLARSAALGAAIREGLTAGENLPVIREIRGLGLMLGIELAHLDAARTPFTDRESYQVRRLCQDAGLLVYHFSSGISLFPALSFSDDEAEQLIEILQEVFSGLV